MSATNRSEEVKPGNMVALEKLLELDALLEMMNPSPFRKAHSLREIIQKFRF
jgi:hypothetical protein